MTKEEKNLEWIKTLDYLFDWYDYIPEVFELEKWINYISTLD